MDGLVIGEACSVSPWPGPDRALLPGVMLPALREDLRLHETAPEADGAPTWVIQDPLNNSFYRIGWLEFECLIRYPAPASEIAEAIASATPLLVDTEIVEDFFRFLAQHRLLRPTADDLRDFGRAARQAQSRDWREWRWWLHHYLFIRFPLVKPDRFLLRSLPWVRPLVSLPALLSLLVASLLGLILVGRQWDEFTHALSESFSPGGMLAFALAVLVSKFCHELGHAFVATRYGVRVAHMGVALVVLWPMLYTDTSESWRLRSSRQRLAVSSAGILVELALAGVATLAWALLPDGVLRQAMLYLATTGWILTLLLNASPFMRFDGYFILSDLLDFPNLHERAGALARHWLRTALFGGEASTEVGAAAAVNPENLPKSARRGLITFALTTWVYRFSLFLGIAVTVYLMFFKALGIFLFAVEIAWFIAMPLWQELRVWHKIWPSVPPGCRRRLGVLVLLPLLLLALPWSYDINAPGLAMSQSRQLVYAPSPAVVSQLRAAGLVRQGELLAGFDIPELAHRASKVSSSIDALNQRLTGQLADMATLPDRQATGARLSEQVAEQTSTRDEQARLRVVAEFDGLWQDVDPMLRPGVWVGVREPLGIVIDPQHWVVEAYVDEAAVDYVRPGARARFLVRGEIVAHAAEVLAIDPVRVSRLPHLALDSRYGGPVVTVAPATAGVTASSGSDKAAAPAKALYRVRMRLDEGCACHHEAVGSVVIAGERRSILLGWLRDLAALIIRESGF